MLHTMDGRSLLPHTGPEHHEGARGLELRLQPVLRVGIVVGYVDPQTAILTKNDERSAMLRTLGVRGGGGGGGGGKEEEGEGEEKEEEKVGGKRKEEGKHLLTINQRHSL